MTKPEILIIDDEPQIRKLLEITLQSNGYSTKSAISAKEGLIMAGNHPPSLILLDLGLPDESGHVVLKKLRLWYTNPIIILSVQKDEEDIIAALDNGANDYLPKPFRTGELLARIRSAMRDIIPEENDISLECEGLEINLSTRAVKKNQNIIKLTATEYNLLALLVSNQGKVLTHHYLLRAIWGPGFINQSNTCVYSLHRFEKKLKTMLMILNIC